MAVGPVATPFAALASAGGGSAVAAQKAPVRSAIHLPSGSLVEYGDSGEAVAAVQRIVGVDTDGIYGPITRGAVQRFQSKAGLPVTGAVDAKTWTALFKSNVSFVSGGGKRTLTVFGRSGGASAPDSPASTAPRSTRTTGSGGGASAPDGPASTAPRSTRTTGSGGGASAPDGPASTAPRS